MSFVKFPLASNRSYAFLGTFVNTRKISIVLITVTPPEAKASIASALDFFLIAMPLTWPGNTKGGSITVPLTSCLTGLN